MRGRRAVRCGGLLLLAAAVLYLVFTAAGIVRYGDVDETRPADAAIVLGAGSAGGTVSPVFQARIDHGVWLYENGYVGTLIFTGGVGEGEQTSDAWAAKCYAVAQGVPETAILLEETSTITQENLANTKCILEEQGLETVLLVSDPLHMKRAMLMARDYGITAYSSPTPTTRYQTWRTKLPFLCREEFFYVGYRLYRLF